MIILATFPFLNMRLLVSGHIYGGTAAQPVQANDLFVVDRLISCGNSNHDPQIEKQIINRRYRLSAFEQIAVAPTGYQYTQPVAWTTLTYDPLILKVMEIKSWSIDSDLDTLLLEKPYADAEIVLCVWKKGVGPYYFDIKPGFQVSQISLTNANCKVVNCWTVTVSGPDELTLSDGLIHKQDQALTILK